MDRSARRRRRAGREGTLHACLFLAHVIPARLIPAIWNIAAKKAGGDARFATFSGLLMVFI